MIELNGDQQLKLLKLARKTIADRLGIAGAPELPSFDDDIFRKKLGISDERFEEITKTLAHS